MARTRRRPRVIFRFKPFSRKQKKILSWWTKKSAVKEADGIIADGSIRAGKTLSMSLSYVMWAMSSFKNEDSGQNFGMAGKTIGSFRRNVLTDLKQMLRTRGYRVKDRRADNILEVTKGDTINFFYIFGGKDESSQDLIQGITLAGMLFDEVALMPESFVNQATGRLSVEGSKMWFNCNPDGPEHWFKKHWLDKREEKNLVYLHFTMDDNLTLSSRMKQRYENMYTGVFYERFILGLWTIAEGVIYDMFDKTRHVVDGLKPTANKRSYVSIDYGTQNATTFILWQKSNDGVWEAVKEYYYSGREERKQKTDSEFADDFEEFVKGYKIRQVILDPSAASFRAELKNRKYQVKSAKNDVIDGIRFTGSLLNEDKIRFSGTCENLIKEFGMYVWDPKATDRGEDKPIKDHDHVMDAVRYFAYTIIRDKGGLKVWK